MSGGDPWAVHRPHGWLARRLRLYERQADRIVRAVKRYEEIHPDDAPCLSLRLAATLPDRTPAPDPGSGRFLLFPGDAETLRRAADILEGLGPDYGRTGRRALRRLARTLRVAATRVEQNERRLPEPQPTRPSPSDPR